MAGELVQLKLNDKVDRFTIVTKLGEGAFGAVYKCSHKTNMYALKVEGATEQIQLLKMEVHVLNELNKSGGRHFCKIEDKGSVSGFNYVVMTLVGKSLADLRLAAPSRHFSMGTALSVAQQCLQALEDLHGIGYLHRDVKPGNYTVGRAEIKELRKIYVLDFGMARKFIHEDGTIKKPRDVAGFRGTVKYAPVETWLYMCCEFTKGTLPWRNLKDIAEIGNMKRRSRNGLTMKQLFGGCPREYIDILRVIDGGKFFDEPNYARCYTLIKQALQNTNSKEYPYDWEEQPGAKPAGAPPPPAAAAAAKPDAAGKKEDKEKGKDKKDDKESPLVEGDKKLISEDDDGKHDAKTDVKTEVKESKKDAKPEKAAK